MRAAKKKLESSGLDLSIRLDTIAREANWEEWIKRYFPIHTEYGFAKEHEDFWRHVWSIEPGDRPPPFVAIWPRGWAKSTSSEMAVAALGARRKKKYVLYVCGTQDQADDHVANIGDMLISPRFASEYPDLSERDMGKYGASAGWRRNRLRTRAGFTVDAIGLDVAARGKKLEEMRPDLIVFDDLDDSEDSERITDKKIRSLTRKLLPAGATDLAVIAVQNLVHPDSIFSRLSDGRAKFLQDRIVSGPISAIEGLEYEEINGRFVLTDGTATWEGMNFERCQEIADDEGPDSFLIERQNRIDIFGRAPFLREWWDGKNRYDPNDLKLKRLVYGRFFAWDTANKQDEEHAYTVGVVGEITRDYRLLIRDVIRDRKEFDELPDWVMRKLKPHASDLKLKGGWIEDAASGVQLLQVLHRTGPAWLRGGLWASRAKGSKEERWAAASVWCRRDCVQLPYPDSAVPWLADFEEELFALRPKFKDQRDAFSELINELEANLGVLSQGWVGRRVKAKAS